MKSRAEYRGGCLCGAVRVVARARSHTIGACHCETCFKWGGGPLLAVECDDDVEFEGADSISVFDSSAWAQRGFCRQCGTHLFYRLKEGGLYAIPVGLFEDVDHWVLAEQIFIDEKRPFYSFSEPTANLTGAEVFARHSGD